MKSLLVEYLRFNNLEKGMLTEGFPYLMVIGTTPVGEIRAPFDHLALLSDLKKLRYQNDITGEKKQGIIKFLSDGIKQFFADLKKFDKECIQLDLVFNASELGLLPFECLLDDDNKPYFANSVHEYILTRRIRQENLPEENWPVVPRVLFVYSDAAEFPKVPSEEHLTCLRSALQPWLTNDTTNVDESKVLTVLRNVHFNRIKDTLEKAIENKNPYTHFHLLAHGMEMDRDYASEFGVALFKTATIEQFDELFKALKIKPFVVSYMVCDSGNAANPMTAKKNIVQVTHKAGVPIVIGSQLPLTMAGSIQITGDFYKGILNGEDVRKVLHRTRCNLYDNKKAEHDWLSFISYIRLPEGYESFLEESVPVREMEALKIIRKETENLIQDKDAPTERYNGMLKRLEQRLIVLLANSETIRGKRVKAGLIEENSGIIGSCYKRLAELVFFRDRVSGTRAGESKIEQIKYLKKSMSWYQKAALFNLSHHWCVVQYLSLDMILNNGVDSRHYRYTVEFSCHSQIKSKEEEKIQIQNDVNPDIKKLNQLEGDIIWALGSLIELYLLSSEEEWLENSLKCKQVTNEFKAKAQPTNDPSFITSLTLQLNRYAEWWIPENDYSLSLKKIGVRAMELLGNLKENATTET